MYIIEGAGVFSNMGIAGTDGSGNKGFLVFWYDYAFSSSSCAIELFIYKNIKHL